MKRERSGKKRVEEVCHGPFRAVIRMDNMGVFSCEYGAIGASGTLPEMREWAKKTLGKLSTLEWHPVMEVHFDDDDSYVNGLKTCSNLNCYMERFWIAWDGSKWVQCPWAVEPAGTYMVIGHASSDRVQPEMTPEQLCERRIAHSTNFHYGPKENVIKWPLVDEGHNGKIYHVPYSEMSWATMLGILDKIRELRAGINKLLSTDSGWQILAKIAESKLLTYT